MAETVIARRDPLEDVLAVERELAELIGNERRNAARWLEERKRDLDQAAHAELTRLQWIAAQDEEAAKRAAVANGAALIDESTSLARRIEALDDAVLRPLVRRHLAVILPGAAS